MKTSCLRLKLVELNFFESFNADNQRKSVFLMYLNIEKFKQRRTLKEIVNMAKFLYQEESHNKNTNIQIVIFTEYKKDKS